MALAHEAVRSMFFGGGVESTNSPTAVMARTAETTESLLNEERQSNAEVKLLLKQMLVKLDKIAGAGSGGGMFGGLSLKDLALQWAGKKLLGGIGGRMAGAALAGGGAMAAGGLAAGAAGTMFGGARSMAGRMGSAVTAGARNSFNSVRGMMGGNAVDLRKVDAMGAANTGKLAAAGGGLDRISSAGAVGAKTVAKIASKFVKVLAVFDGIEGAFNADELLGKKTDIHDKVITGVASALDSLSFGILGKISEVFGFDNFAQAFSKMDSDVSSFMGSLVTKMIDNIKSGVSSFFNRLSNPDAPPPSTRMGPGAGPDAPPPTASDGVRQRLAPRMYEGPPPLQRPGNSPTAPDNDPGPLQLRIRPQTELSPNTANSAVQALSSDTRRSKYVQLASLGGDIPLPSNLTGGGAPAGLASERVQINGLQGSVDPGVANTLTRVMQGEGMFSNVPTIKSPELSTPGSARDEERRGIYQRRRRKAERDEDEDEKDPKDKGGILGAILKKLGGIIPGGAEMAGKAMNALMNPGESLRGMLDGSRPNFGGGGGGGGGAGGGAGGAGGGGSGGSGARVVPGTGLTQTEQKAITGFNKTPQALGPDPSKFTPNAGSGAAIAGADRTTQVDALKSQAADAMKNWDVKKGEDLYRQADALSKGQAANAPADKGPIPFTGDWTKAATKDEVGGRRAAIMDRLVRTHGLSPDQAAGIVGNLEHESGGYKVTSYNGKGESSHGMFQWNDAAAAGHRWTKLQAIAAEKGYDLNTPQGQVDAAVEEAKRMKDRQGVSVWDKQKAATTKQEASDNWLNKFEMPKERVRNSIVRGEAAVQAGKDYAAAGGNGSKGPVALPNVPTAQMKPGDIDKSPVAGAEGLFSKDPMNKGMPQGYGVTAGGTPNVIERQGEIARTRRLAIQDDLKQKLQFAAEKAGVTAEVGSGGQAAPGEGGPRTGSNRHDHGGAADLKLYETGPDGKKRLLDQNNPADQEKMKKFAEESVRAGATGIGAADNYMGPSTMHIGGGTPSVWGAKGGAPYPWIADAHKAGMADQEAGKKEFEAWKAARAAGPANDKIASVDAKPKDFGASGMDLFGNPVAAKAPTKQELKDRSLGAMVRKYREENKITGPAAPGGEAEVTLPEISVGPNDNKPQAGRAAPQMYSGAPQFGPSVGSAPPTTPGAKTAGTGGSWFSRFFSGGPVSVTSPPAITPGAPKIPGTTAPGGAGYAGMGAIPGQVNPGAGSFASLPTPTATGASAANDGGEGGAGERSPGSPKPQTADAGTGKVTPPKQDAVDFNGLKDEIKRGNDNAEKKQSAPEEKKSATLKDVNLQDSMSMMLVNGSEVA